MVYFEKGAEYGSKTVIMATKVDKGYLTYRYAKGTVLYTVPIHWARLKHIGHPVQFIRVRGTPIWAVEKR